MHEVLVERVVLRDQHRERAIGPASRAAGLLPHRCPGARIPGQHGGVEGADVDPELERGGRGDGQQVSVREPALDLPAVLREVPGAIGDDPVAAGRVADLASCELREQLCSPPRPREPDGPDVLRHELPHQPGRLGQRAPPTSGLLVDDGGVPQGEELVPGGSAGGLDDVDVEPGQPRRELAGVADRRARETPTRAPAVVRDEPSEASKHHRDVRAEHPAAHVRLVDHDHREPEEEVGPSRVVGEDRQMEHVGVRQHEVRVLPDQRSLGLGRVAVVGGPPDLRELQGAHRAELVARERFRREQIQGRRFGDGDGGLRERDVVHQGLSARGAGREDHVSSGSEGLEPSGLMRVEPLDAEQAEAGAHDLGQVLRERIQPRLSRSQLPHAHETGSGVGILRRQLLEERSSIHRSASRRAAATGDPPRPLRGRPAAASQRAPHGRRRRHRA